MKLIKITDIKDDTIFQRSNFINGITLLDADQRKFIIEAADYDQGIIQRWFDIINIRYEKVKIINNDICYTVNGYDLRMPDLSSGERYLLFLLAGKAKNEKIIANGLFERLDCIHEKIALKQFKDYDNLTVILYNSKVKQEDSCE